MFQRFLSLETRRKRALSQSMPGALHDYLSTPLAPKKSQCDDLSIVALDLETTGLDPRKDKILSYGLVEIQHMTVRLETSRHQLISIDEEIPEESAVINQITDDQAATGIGIKPALHEILERMAGKVMLDTTRLSDRTFSARSARSSTAPLSSYRPSTPWCWRSACSSAATIRCRPATCACSICGRATIYPTTRRTTP